MSGLTPFFKIDSIKKVYQIRWANTPTGRGTKCRKAAVVQSLTRARNSLSIRRKAIVSLALAGVFFAFCPPSWAKPFSQEIYEEQIKMRCADVSQSEIDTLKSCEHDSSKNQFHDLDQVAEYLVFNPIAERESSQLTCMLDQARKFRDDPHLQNDTIHNICEEKDIVFNGKSETKIELLRDTLNDEASLTSWLQTYTNVNDPTVRQIPEREYAKNIAVIAELKKRLKIDQDLEESIRASNPLLSSPSVFGAIQSRFADGYLVSGDSTKKVCLYLRANAKSLLDNDVYNLKYAKKTYDEKLKSGAGWLDDEPFKRRLWESGSRDAVFGQLERDQKFQQSTFCRMEGRYGKGAKTRDALYNIATLALGGGAEVTPKFRTT